MNISEFLKKENNNLDFCRLVCATMVIVGHSYILFPNNGSKDILFRLIGFTYSGAVAVKFFFFISGLLVANSLLKKQSVVDFVIARFFRVMPALIVLVILSALIIGPIVSSLPVKDYFKDPTFTYYIKNNLSLKTSYYLPGTFNANLFPNAVNGSLWSIRYEVACYICLVAFFTLIRTNKWLLNIIGLSVLADAFFKTKVFFNWLGNNPEVNQLPFFFVLGVLFAVNKDIIKITFLKLLGLMFLAVIFWKSEFNQYLFLVSCCYFLLWLSSLLVIRKLKFKYDISYGVYLWGFLVQQIIYCFFLNKSLYINMALSIAVTYLLGFLSFYLIERKAIELGKIFSARVSLFISNTKDRADKYL